MSVSTDAVERTQPGRFRQGWETLRERLRDQPDLLGLRDHVPPAGPGGLPLRFDPTLPLDHVVLQHPDGRTYRCYQLGPDDLRVLHPPYDWERQGL